MSNSMKLLGILVCSVVTVLYLINRDNVSTSLSDDEQTDITQTALSERSVLPSEPSKAEEKQSEEPTNTTPSRTASERPKNQNAYEDFEKWLTEFKTNNSQATLDEGLEIAKQRRELLEVDIVDNPKKALQEALSYNEYDSLPKTIQSIVEQPITRNVELNIIPVESREHRATVKTNNLTVIHYKENGKHFSHQVTLFGNRKNILSKENLAVQGIRLGGFAAIEDTAFEVVVDADNTWAEQTLAVGNHDITKDYYTNEEITSTPIKAISGKRIYYFANKTNIEQLNAALTQLENKIGPRSHLLKAKLSNGAASRNTNNATYPNESLQNQLSQKIVAASTWTETKKKVFFLRVDFSDLQGEPVSQSALETELNDVVSKKIKDFSYGKTDIEGSVDGSLIKASSQVIRLPKAGTYYRDLDEQNFAQGSSELHQDAITAFTALNTGIDLSAFDIIGIYFGEIGMGYNGLATIGGKSQWFQKRQHTPLTDTQILVHEFGHNYGLEHADFWGTTGNKSVGGGYLVNYGDIHDTMGNTSLGHFHMQAKSKLNWMPTSEWKDIKTSGTHKIYRFDQNMPNTNTKALRITQEVNTTGGTNSYYWLGYRREFTDNAVLQSGAYIIWQYKDNTKSFLIDTTPGSKGAQGSVEDRQDAGISIGRTYSDADAKVHITPLEKGGSGSDEWLDIRVNIGEFADNQKPSVKLNAPSISTPGEALTFSAIASDPDGDILSYQWDFGDGKVHSNAASATNTWETEGTYTVKITVSDMKGGTATQQLTIAITSDSDNDGLPNSIEKLLNLDPQKKDTDGDGIDDGLEDSDKDGIPNKWEVDHGLNPNDASDATKDRNNNNENNLNEYRREIGSSTPLIKAPAPMTVASTGYKTYVNLAAFNAYDAIDGELKPQHSAGNQRFRPGRHTITWSVTNSQGKKASATQQVDVLPRVDFESDRNIREGKILKITAQLNGNAPSYPVKIPIVTSGTATLTEDYTLSATEIVITSGHTGEVEITTKTDGTAEGEETVIVALGKLPNNVAKGGRDKMTVKIKEVNSPPQVRLQVEQNNKKSQIVKLNGGTVTIKAITEDPDEDELDFNWDTGGTLTDLGTDDDDGDLGALALKSKLDDDDDDDDDDGASTFEFDPTQAGVGLHKKTLTINDGNGGEVKKTVTIRVKDEKGQDESLFLDENENGVPDLYDNFDFPHLLSSDGGAESPMETEPGLYLTTGDIGFDQESYQGRVSEAQIAGFLANNGLGAYQGDNAHSLTNDIYDYSVKNLTTEGESISIVLTLLKPIEANAKLRKYHDINGWIDFVVDESNGYYTWSSSEDNCTFPDTDITTITEGLKEGANCLQIIIEDGGPNDADGEVNGEIYDPVAIATVKSSSSGSSGDSDSDSTERNDNTSTDEDNENNNSNGNTNDDTETTTTTTNTSGGAFELWLLFLFVVALLIRNRFSYPTQDNRV